MATALPAKSLCCPAAAALWAGPICSATASTTGVGPSGYVFTTMDSKCGTAIFNTRRPCVADFPADCDPCVEIHDGDYIRLDGINGTVEILVPAEDK